MSNTTPQTMKRRKFLKLAGITAGVSAAACCGLGGLASLQPKVELTEDKYQGENAMKQRILVVYASKAGSTGEVAGEIGQVLAAKGAAVDVCPVKDARDISAYQAVIVGSAIRMGSWLPAAARFVEANKLHLSQVPTAYFSCGMGLREENEKNRGEALATMDAARAIVNPVAVGAFAGKMNFSKLSFLDRTIIKAMGGTEGDFRPWETIRAWASGLPLG